MSDERNHLHHHYDAGGYNHYDYEGSGALFIYDDNFRCNDKDPDYKASLFVDPLKKFGEKQRSVEPWCGGD